MQLWDFWNFETDCLFPVEELIIKHFAISRKYTQFKNANILSNFMLFFSIKGNKQYVYIIVNKIQMKCL